MMDEMFSDRITVLKPDGQRFENLKSVVERDAIILDAAGVPVDDGDHIERQLPDGRKELYEVLHSGFTRGDGGLGGIPDFYHMKVRKTTSRLPAAGGATHISVSGPNARLNLNSTDNSSNVVGTVVPPEVFAQLVAALRAQVQPQSDLEALERKVRELESHVGTPAYNRAYAEFVQLGANWMTIVAPFIPALSKALAGA